ncbi:hypothetical protein CLHUN_11470 [Ruminiclostridium hungatei]|uniref:Glycosyltransferase RgtA/B/C/D-like domain-containing protein n=1 Tax=Ruminiclostridium hungatei TaxID=48256 RepID=A0A1V4SN72_RUMHU|nr:glycosyltransferase family 39 protein [Ruminiclostridium hungatei]OPX44915.1 hypothetical protein CLHUN_11470 [Ruminiclostridium hungatei]
METCKNWFTYIYLTIFGICLSYSLFSATLNMGVNAKYPFIWYGGMLIVMGGLWLVLNTSAAITSHFRLSWVKPGSRKAAVFLEAFVLLSIVTAAALLRFWIISNLPMQPESDYLTYYKVAELLAQGKLISDGAGYCDYISQFPHVMGFPYILSLVFRVFGVSVSTGLYFNLAVSLLSIFFVHRTARLLAGNVGGILAAALVAFWPSQILYINQMASEPVFMCLTLICIWIAARLFKAPDGEKAWKILVFNIALGILLAIAGGVRPVAIILLIAIIICSVTYKARLTGSAEAGLIKSCMSRGWIRALAILTGYMACSLLISAATAKAIDRELPGTTASFGYNLMVGFNIESRGGWNEKDSSFLTQRFAETGSAEEAHIASRAMALSRLKEDPVGIANLIFQKYTLLWENDDYGSYWNLLFLKQQNNLTSQRNEFINSVTIWNNIYYIICVYLSLLAGIYLWFGKKVGTEHVLVLYFIGIAMLHMFLESQSRYHYNILPVFAILASAGAVEIFIHHADARRTATDSIATSATDFKSGEQSLEKAAAIEEQKSSEEELIEKEAGQIDNKFNLLDAIKQGHVTVTVTEAYLNSDKDKKEPGEKE